MVTSNAAEKPGLIATPPRLRIWTAEERDAMIAAADAAPEKEGERSYASIGDAVMLACYAGPILFWVPALRDAYIYHYLPSYAFALPLLAGLVSKMYATKRHLALAFVVLVFQVSLFYAPLAAELPISEGAMKARLLPPWR